MFTLQGHESLFTKSQVSDKNSKGDENSAGIIQQDTRFQCRFGQTDLNLIPE